MQGGALVVKTKDNSEHNNSRISRMRMVTMKVTPRLPLPPPGSPPPSAAAPTSRTGRSVCDLGAAACPEPPSAVGRLSAAAAAGPVAAGGAERCRCARVVCHSGRRRTGLTSCSAPS